ncbi:TPA: hypothetical protein ACYEND_005368, partial [Escherichia coli]
NLKETTCWVERTIQMVNYRLISLALTNRDIATIHSNIVQEYNTLKGYSWKWLGGVSVAFLVMFCVLGWGMKTILDRNYNATAAVYQKVVTLEDKLVEKPVTGKSRKN